MGALSRDADIGFGEAFRYATVYNPTAPVTSEDAAYKAFGGYFQFGGSFDQFNPVAIIEQGTNTDKIGNLFGNIKGDLLLILVGQHLFRSLKPGILIIYLPVMVEDGRAATLHILFLYLMVG